MSPRLIRASLAARRWAFCYHMKLPRHIYLYPVLLTLTSLPSVGADTILWYNGDYAGGSGTVNENASNIGPANIYDDFDVTASGGWIVQRLWSNDCMLFQDVTSASWSIRSGMFAGNGGTIVASGITAAQQTATGRTAWWGYPEYSVEISGRSIYLSPGEYWLSVSPLVGNDPLSNGQYSSYISQTWGANAIGTPSGNNGNSFDYHPSVGRYFAVDYFHEDYSMGVAGTVVPEPSTWALSAVGGVFVLVNRRRGRIQKIAAAQASRSERRAAVKLTRS
jgi:hypothetical protein